MFTFKRGAEREKMPASFDPSRQRAALRCSICTGEQVAGFQDLRSGQFEEVMLIRGEADLQRFKSEYGVREIVKIY